MTKKVKGAGGKLARSEIIQTRLSPKLRQALEILSRLQRRTVSSLMEHLVEKEVIQTELEIGSGGHYPPIKKNLMKFMDEIWQHHEAVRFVRFAMAMPDLLTPEELDRYIRITNTPYFWLHKKVAYTDINGNVFEECWKSILSLETLVEKNLIEYWHVIKKDEFDFKDLPSFENIGGKINSETYYESRKNEYLYELMDSLFDAIEFTSDEYKRMSKELFDINQQRTKEIAEQYGLDARHVVLPLSNEDVVNVAEKIIEEREDDNKISQANKKQSESTEA